jgi:hypothetical protein
VSGHANKNARFDQSGGAAYNVQAASAAPFLDDVSTCSLPRNPGEGSFLGTFSGKGECWLNRETDCDCLRSVEDLEDITSAAFGASEV